MSNAEDAPLKVWLDDRRNPPDETWLWMTTPQEVIDLLERGGVDQVSLDHDLALFDAEGREHTGYDVLLWIEEQVVVHGFVAPKLAVHSANPAAHERMLKAIESIERGARS